MTGLLMKQAGVLLLATINAILLLLALTAYRQRRPLSPSYAPWYFRLLPISIGVALFQVGVGLYFLLEGRQAHPMHLFYGVLVGTGAVLQFLLRPSTAIGQRYGTRPIVHMALALFVALLGIRSWMSG